MRSSTIAIRTLALLAFLAGCPGGEAPVSPAFGDSPDPARDLVVRRGEFRDRFLLTGELQAVKADDIVAPRTPVWLVAIRWMEKDGAEVKAGQKVLEFDNSAFASDLEEKRLSLAEAESDLAQAESDAQAQEEDRIFALEERRVALEKARIEATVPEELSDRRRYQERQLALRRAETEFQKAGEDLAAQRASALADLENRRISVEKARREIRLAEAAIDALALSAPRGGILVVAENPWEDRKFEVGDTVADHIRGIKVNTLRKIPGKHGGTRFPGWRVLFGHRPVDENFCKPYTFITEYLEHFVVRWPEVLFRKILCSKTILI